MKVFRIKIRRGWACLLCGAAACILAAVFLPGAGKEQTLGRNAAEQIAFLEQFGWKTGAAPVETASVQIPQVFDEVYLRYNQLQLDQGFDLRPYAGKKEERYQYEITNYPNFTDEIRANLLVFEGEIIGGDVCSLALGGFMHGFSKESGEKTSS